MAQVDPRILGNAALNVVIQQHIARRIVFRHHVEVELQLVVAVDQIGRQRNGQLFLARVAAEAAPQRLQNALFDHRQVAQEGIVQRHAQLRALLVDPALRRETVAYLQRNALAVPQIEVRRGAESDAQRFVPDAADRHALVFTQQLADFDRPVGSYPARGVVGLAQRNGLCRHLQAARLRRKIAARQPPGRRPQGVVVAADDQQQLVDRVVRVINDAQQRLAGLRQRQLAHLLAGMANHDAVLFRQLVTQRIEGDTAIVGLDAEPGGDQRRGAHLFAAHLFREADADAGGRHLHIVEEGAREVA